MADSPDPPLLFENVDIKNNEDDDDDLFASAIQDHPPLLSVGDNHREISNGESDISKLQITPPKLEMETVPINNQDSTSTPTIEEVEAESRDQFIDISITENQKVGDGMGAYVLYRVCTKTNMPLFKKREVTVMRRFSDFLGLHDKLMEKYLKVGRIIPPAPEKSVIGERTKVELVK